MRSKLYKFFGGFTAALFARNKDKEEEKDAVKQVQDNSKLFVYYVGILKGGFCSLFDYIDKTDFILLIY
jgi:hypothetical protein